MLYEPSHIEAIPGTRNKLRHLALRTLAIIRSDPVLSRFMLMELRPDPNYRSSPFFELNRRFTHEVVEVCQQAIESGEIAKDVSATLLRDMFLGCIEDPTWPFLRGEGEFSSEEVADGVAEVICRGMTLPTLVSADPAAIAARLARIESLLTDSPQPKLGD